MSAFGVFRTGVPIPAGQNEYVLFSAIDNVVATAGGGQANAYLIKDQIVKVGTVATGADSVKLPKLTLPGHVIHVINAGANALAVFPNTGDQINALGANTSFSLAAGKSCLFVSATAGQWYTNLSA